jgi:hypothetical protein
MAYIPQWAEEGRVEMELNLIRCRKSNVFVNEKKQRIKKELERSKMKILFISFFMEDVPFNDDPKSLS